MYTTNMSYRLNALMILRNWDQNYSLVTLVRGQHTAIMQLQSVATFGHPHSKHPCRLLATSGPLEARADASRKVLVTWDNCGIVS